MCALSAPIPRGSGLRVQITACAPSISLRPPVQQTKALTGQQGPAGRTDRSRPAAPLDPERYTGAAFDLHPMSSDEDATDFLKLCGSAHQPALSVRWGDFGEGERRCIARWRWHFVISNWILGNRTKRSPDCRNQASGPINQRGNRCQYDQGCPRKDAVFNKQFKAPNVFQTQGHQSTSTVGCTARTGEISRRVAP